MARKGNSTYDAIVVGSGPGGATVARELSHRGKKVLILEWGKYQPIKGTYTQAISMAMIPGKSFLFTDNMLALVRAITAGGSSVVFYGTAYDPPVEMFKSYGIDITDEVTETKRELPVAPLADELIGPMARRIMDSAIELGYKWNKLSKFVYQDKCRQGCDKCNLGCPYDAKWNAQFFIKEAINNGATILDSARVTKALTDNKKAVGVEYMRRGTTYQAFADTVVVAAGGIGTPLILRATGIKNAGYNFFYDPIIAVFGTAKDISGGREFPMAAGIRLEDEGYLMTDMTVPQLLYQIFTAEVGRLDKLFTHSHTLTIMIKIKDDLSGMVADDGSIKKPLTESDLKKLGRGYERAQTILKKAGAKDIYKSWYFASHPGGTAKIGDVVDSNLQTQFEGLYVCDCSVIPEAWGLPPVLTIIALAKRLTKHLTDRAEAKIRIKTGTTT